MIKGEDRQIDKEIGKRLRILRKIRKMSQVELAQQSGITFQQIQKYEKGINGISASRLYRLSSILDISIYFFFNDLPPLRKIN